jgi:hypothetical protein
MNYFFSFYHFIKYEPFQQLYGHTNNICVVDAMYFNTEIDSNLVTYLASASVDSTVRIWSRSSDFNLTSKGEKAAFNLEQVITAKANGFALALKFYLLPISKRIKNLIVNILLNKKYIFHF